MPSVVALVALLSLWMFSDAKITAAFLHRFGNCGQLLRPTPSRRPRLAGPPGLLPTRESPGRELGVIRTKVQHRADSRAGVPRPCPSETDWQGRDYDVRELLSSGGCVRRPGYWSSEEAAKAPSTAQSWRRQVLPARSVR